MVGYVGSLARSCSSCHLTILKVYNGFFDDWLFAVAMDKSRWRYEDESKHTHTHFIIKQSNYVFFKKYDIL